MGLIEEIRAQISSRSRELQINYGARLAESSLTDAAPGAGAL